MAQVIAPEVWQDGINDNQLLPNRYTVGLFTGRGINIANDGRACRVYDIVTSDYITDYDDRRLNGHSYGAQDFNADGRDGWGASAYGVFQTVKFTSVVYSMTRHRSTAMRIMDEMQYDAREYGQDSDGIGVWGSATQAYVSSNGQALLKTAALMSKAKERWEKQVLGPDIDKYVLVAICNGRQNGRLVGNVDGVTGVNYNDRVFDGDAAHYTWQAAPGAVAGASVPPKFAPIHCIEWDDEHIPQMLQNVKVTWNNLFIDQSDRVVLIDPFYEYALLSALTGSGVPATDSAYTDMQNGSFTKLMGWDFNFEIPSNYWPQIYVDKNLNVVHSADGSGACDRIINSIDGGTGNDKLLRELLASDRMSRTNWYRTDWNATTGEFTHTLTNYPLGSPAFDGYYDTPAVVIDNPDWTAVNLAYPWDGQGAGYGLKKWDGSETDAGDLYPNTAMATGPQAPITKVPVIGMFLWKKAAQMSQEYSEMVTDEGRTRGKFQEMCMDVKYDAFVIENYSAGIIPIINSEPKDVTFSIPVSVVNEPVTTLDVPATLVSGTLDKSSVVKSAAATISVATLSYSKAAPVSPTLSYQWQYLPTGTSAEWTNISGNVSNVISNVSGYNTAALTATPAAGVVGLKFRCVVAATGTATGTINVGECEVTNS